MARDGSFGSGLRSIAAGMAAVDPVIAHLGACLLPALDNPKLACQQFVDYLSRALQAHVDFKYGSNDAPSAPPCGGLAPWQERLAKELLTANLDGGLAIEEVAQRCELSAGHFARAFKQSTGYPPHRWLMERRVEKSQELLLGGLPISEIAMASGFSDQSHFTRVFSGRIGMSPGAWRRMHRNRGSLA